MSQSSWSILLDLLMGAAAGLAGGFVRWNNPERRRLGWCLAWELPSAARVGSAGYALGGLFELNEYGRFFSPSCSATSDRRRCTTSRWR